MKPRAIIYIRQSVARDESISPELQEAACRAYAERKGYDVIDVEQDLGISGRTWKRPAVVRVMEAIERKHCDVILLWKWSRLSRSRRDWGVAIDRCDVAGGRIESATEEIDTSTATGRLARGMMVEFAAFESERIGDTWREAHARRVKQGRPHNGMARFGYLQDDDGHYYPDPATADVVRDLYSRYIAGESFFALAVSLNERGFKTRRGAAFTAASVLQMLDRLFYTGRITWHGESLPGAHEGLIDEATWAAYREARTLRRVSAEKTTKTRSLLAGFIRCNCGSKMNAHNGGSRAYPRYECNAAHRPGYECDAVVKSIDLREADRAVSNWIREVAARVQDATPDDEPAPEVAGTLAKIDDTNAAIAKLTVEYARGIIPEAAYTAASAALSAEVQALERDAGRVLRAAGRRGRITSTLLEAWDTYDVNAQRAILSELIERVEWRGPRGMRKVFDIYGK